MRKSTPVSLKLANQSVELLEDSLNDLEELIENYHSFGNIWARDKSLDIINRIKSALYFMESLEEQFNYRYFERFEPPIG